MSELANKQAFPCAIPKPDFWADGTPVETMVPGMTFREYAAVQIMAGITPSPESTGERIALQEVAPDYARVAVWMTDALIAALAKEGA